MYIYEDKVNCDSEFDENFHIGLKKKALFKTDMSFCYRPY